MKAIPELISLFKLHIASFWSQKLSLAIIAFIFCIFIIALSIAIGFNEISLMTKSAWISLPIFAYAILFLSLSTNHKRSEIFHALGFWNAWCHAQILAHLCIQFIYILVWNAIIAICHENIVFCTQQTALMMIFAAVFSQATLASLQSKTMGLNPFKQYTLIAVVSSPWILMAWILGYMASMALLRQQPVLLPILALVLLGIVQTMMHFMFRHPQKCDP